jgi:molybdenum cofactor sulfurtransferase
MEQIRAIEFARIGDAIYVDHAGATLYSERHVLEATADLVSGVYGNPHSSGAASAKTLEAIKGVRKMVLGHFGVSGTTHDCIFTSGATASLKLIGESFPFSHGSKFKYAANCHVL